MVMVVPVPDKLVIVGDKLAQEGASCQLGFLPGRRALVKAVVYFAPIREVHRRQAA